MKYNICTNIDVIGMEFKWDILNYSLNGKAIGEHLLSPVLKWNESLSCFLGLFPKGTCNNDDYVSLYIYRSEKYPKLEVEYSFAVLDSKGNETNQYTRIEIIQDCYGHGANKFISLSDLKQYLINNKLTVVCKAKAGINIFHEVLLIPELIGTSVDELSEDFQILLEKQKFTDVILSVKGKTFNAHKAILSARSSVFSALFEHEMQENINSRVDIEDAEPNVVEEMLRFIYTGKVKDLNLIAYELLEMSNKYFLEGLKSMCVNTLCNNLTVENVLQILSLADLINAKALKTTALKFSIAHAKEMIQTAAFKSSENINLQIFSDLFQEFALK